MSVLALAIDPDPTRRERFLEGARSTASSFQGLVRGEARVGDLVAFWARPPRAPCDVGTGEGTFALVLGDAFVGPRATRLGAADVIDGPIPGVRDGLHLLVRRRADGTLEVEADLLGVIPVYYARVPGAFLVSTTPDAFRRHPAFRPAVDVLGLAAILRSNGLLGGRTLLEGVRRLGPGRRLERRAGGEVREVGADALPAPRRLSSRRLEDAVEALDHVLEDAVRRHVPPGEVGLLLTGGRDSRLLAGYLARAGRRVRAFTLGRAHDAEVRIARSVARRLGVPHEHAETEPEAHTEHVALVGRYEALSAGGSGTDKWSMARLLRFAPASTVAGLAMDSIVGPAFSVWGGARQDRGASYAGAVAFLDAWGLGAEAIRGLLRPEHADAAAEVERLVRREWEDEPGDDVARAWRFVLRHRHRFHTGAFAHAVAFASWPAFPAVDRRVLESCFQEPPAVLGERRAEDALLRRRFPELASLPVDRNAWDDLPLLPSVPRRVGAALERRVRPIRRARRAWRRRHGDPRRYYRTYDVNAETWRAARQRAEAGREAAHAFLRPEALAALLPPPDARIEAADPIASTAPVRSLIALLAWLAESEGSLRDSTVGGAPRGAPGRA